MGAQCLDQPAAVTRLVAVAITMGVTWRLCQAVPEVGALRRFKIVVAHGVLEGAVPVMMDGALAVAAILELQEPNIVI